MRKPSQAADYAKQDDLSPSLNVGLAESARGSPSERENGVGRLVGPRFFRVNRRLLQEAHFKHCKN